MFLQTYSKLSIMLNKNDDVKRNMSKIYINYLFKIMMLNTMFTFHYELNQNTSCKLKFAVHRQQKRLSNRRHRRRSEQPFYLLRVYPRVTPPMMLG